MNWKVILGLIKNVFLQSILLVIIILLEITDKWKMILFVLTTMAFIIGNIEINAIQGKEVKRNG